MSAIGDVSLDWQECEPVDESKLWGLGWCCIPWFGFWVGSISEEIIKKNLDRTIQPPRLIELLQLKNDYHTASVVREIFLGMIEVAITVSLIAAHSFTTASLIGIAVWSLSVGLGVGIIALRAVAYNLNQKTIEDLKYTGYRPGMIFH